jgi:hypothetical protein
MMLLLLAPGARAADPPLSPAEQLFREGKALMKEQQYERACEKLTASYGLDRTATGTLLNLALCHEQTNKTATAWAEFRQVAAESTGRRDDRVTFAREHEAKLLPMLSRLTVVVPEAARVPGLRVRLDERTVIDEMSWGKELPVDPGKHEIEASANGRVSANKEVVVGDTADHVSVTLDPLAARPEGATAPRTDDGARTRRWVGFALGGVGLSAIGIGLAFGATAGSRNDEAKALCPNNLCPSPTVKDDASAKLSAANTSANVANVLAAVGTLAIIGGLVLVLTARSNAVRVSPVVMPGSGGAVLVSGSM